MSLARRRRPRLSWLVAPWWLLPSLAFAVPGTVGPAGVRLGRLHLFFSPAGQWLRVAEIHAIRSPRGRRSLGAGLTIPLFPGARKLRLEAVPEGVAVSSARSGLILRGQLPARRSQLRLAYEVPRSSRLERWVPLPVRRVVVVATGAGAQLGGALFRRVRAVEGPRATHRSAVGGPLRAGGRLALTVSFPPAVGRPPASAPRREASKAAALVRDWRIVAMWLAPLLALGIFFFAMFLAGRPRSIQRGPENRLRLERERERLLCDLASVIRAARAGQRGARRREQELTHRLADIYRRLDESQGRSGDP